MRRFLFRLWAVPWPSYVRRWIGRLVELGPVQRLFVPRFEVGVVGVIENRTGELLLLRHTYRSRYAWGLPTGFLERGEQPQDAMRREIEEEAGLRVQLYGVCTVDVHRRRPLVSIVYRGQFTGGDFVPSAEVSEARFFPRDLLPAMMPDQRALLTSIWDEERTT